MKKGRPPKRQKKLKGGPPKLSAYNRFVKKFMKGRKGKATANMKAAARAWRAQGKKVRVSPRSTSTRARVRRAPAKKGGTRKVGKRSGLNQQKIFKLVRLAALAIPAADIAMTQTSNQAKFNAVSEAYFGYSPATNNFKLERLARGWGPLLGATLVTYGIPKLVGLLRGL